MHTVLRQHALRTLAALVAILMGSAKSSNGDPAEPADSPAAQDAVAVFSGRFVVCRVTTDLERQLLGSYGDPLDKASVSVFVDSREFRHESPISVKSRPFLLLSAWLEDQAKLDDRLAMFRVIVDVGGEPFDVTQARAEELSRICQDLARQAGYQDVRSSQTFGLDWKQRIIDAERAILQEAIHDSQSSEPAHTDVGNEQLRVYAVRTHLERLLTSADCVVDIRAVLDQTHAGLFPDDFVAGMQKLVPQLDYEGEREMLVCVRFTEAAAGGLAKWVDDVEGRKAFARQFGFEFCNLQQTQVAEDDERSPP